MVGASGSDYLVNTARANPVGFILAGFFPDNPEHVRFRRGKAHVIANAQLQRFRSTLLAQVMLSLDKNGRTRRLPKSKSPEIHSGLSDDVRQTLNYHK